MQNLDKVRNALLSVTQNVGHYKAFKKEPPYVVWAEDSANSLRNNNQTGEQSLKGLAHLFTRTENDPLATQIQTAFNASGIAWYLESIQYEKGTGYIHYAWAWEV